MSTTFEDFVSRFEAATPAVRSRAIDLILAEAESEPDSDPPIDVDPFEAAAKVGISREQIERLNRAIGGALAYRAAQNNFGPDKPRAKN